MHVSCPRYARAVQQFGGGGAATGFGVSSPVFVPSGGLGAVDGGGLLGDIDAGFKVHWLPARDASARFEV
jgi:hypothetical protein